MIVCVCKGVSDRKILNVIQDGARTVDAVTRQCRAGGDCGSCRHAIADIIDDQGRLDVQLQHACALRHEQRTGKRAA